MPDEDRTIRRGEIYPLDDWQRRSKIGRAGRRQLEKKGFRVIRIANRCYVSGDDWLDFLDEIEQQRKDSIDD